MILIAGLVVLYFGAEAMVKGATQLALAFGISPMIVGLTVVAFGTSAPEFLVSLLAVVGDAEGISVGNIIGSNFCNLALILGVAALLTPLPIAPSSLRLEYPFMLVATLGLSAAAINGHISHLEGGVMTAGILFFIGWQLRGAFKLHQSHRDSEERETKATTSTGKNLLYLLGGLLGLAIGAHLMVTSAADIARSFGISEFIVGTSIVAFGTSLPELATSVVAALRRQTDISVGNVLGSNIFNSFFVMGIIPGIFGLDVESRAIQIDIPAMILVTLLVFPLMRTRYKLGRGEGALLLSLYVVYIGTMFLWPQGW